MITAADREKARELAQLFGGNGLSELQQIELVAAKLAEFRHAARSCYRDPRGVLVELTVERCDGEPLGCVLEVGAAIKRRLEFGELAWREVGTNLPRFAKLEVQVVGRAAP